MPIPGEHPFVGKTDDGHYLEMEWNRSWTALTANANGVSGWALILRSSGGSILEGSCLRVHKCAHNPCRARWNASKYGMMAPPVHVQEVDPTGVSFCPGSAPLHSGHIPEPAAIDPQLRMEALSGNRHGADIVGQRLFAKIWTLARQIRTPRTYVGYSFFLLVAIA